MAQGQVLKRQFTKSKILYSLSRCYDFLSSVAHKTRNYDDYGCQSYPSNYNESSTSMKSPIKYNKQK